MSPKKDNNKTKKVLTPRDPKWKNDGKKIFKTNTAVSKPVRMKVKKG